MFPHHDLRITTGPEPGSDIACPVKHRFDSQAVLHLEIDAFFFSSWFDVQP